jgi:hypothetical protein
MLILELSRIQKLVQERAVWIELLDLLKVSPGLRLFSGLAFQECEIESGSRLAGIDRRRPFERPDRLGGVSLGSFLVRIFSERSLILTFRRRQFAGYLIQKAQSYVEINIICPRSLPPSLVE